MKRDPRLHGLSSDHHHALWLAFDIRAAARADELTPELLARVRTVFTRELLPHFDVEEAVLLDGLDRVGEHALAARTRREHEELRAELAAADADVSRLQAFADRLTAHVRFEEGELFAACEARLPAAVLDEAERRAPKLRTHPR